MQKKVWIGLEGMEFYAHHGVYAEERKIGGRYVVDVWVQTDASLAEKEDDLNGTINYEKIFNVVHQKMQEPVQLIEHLARKIMDSIQDFVPIEDKIRIKIRKINPPLGAKVEASVIEMEN
ncbi:MAG TPA: dihydroneopterin aldolase [Chitinophagales bacterium]|jgi:dihydroneopterin aldolase|nr:dihydroneopterin aldolase [Chitinophagales bacterium]MBP6155191.1 dihydroneopterin aldolase [Chitinophagales bacterium]HQV78196.1 dihydroneopterin aldolase [Chitinophagales bacterium]HQW79393.1 dihydroneopterin aldolase [Chitinophagales bacterium]HRB66172.1 dihydroneopterin aldolase [Chitinophagales bacterium]